MKCLSNMDSKQLLKMFQSASFNWPEPMHWSAEASKEWAWSSSFVLDSIYKNKFNESMEMDSYIYGTLTAVCVLELCILESFEFLVSPCLLSFTRRIAHLQVKRRSTTPRESTIMNSMIIADPKAVLRSRIAMSLAAITKIYAHSSWYVDLSLTMSCQWTHWPFSDQSYSSLCR